LFQWSVVKEIKVNKKLEELVKGRSVKIGVVMNTIAMEIVKSADNIINIDDHDERREAWAALLDELGIPWQDMMQ
tara:strand:+ start:1499 stop:1723 length:225 start_codon:yes stop_codon:yes gene_type:complete